ncbi:methionyl-tRNA formyltransferase [Roseateles toxinivorans]|uniref:Methionyl-tRNA formyltransferase n=1 Tax=Roseateles toxinivorans TaxID=270368 RepID=A0A4R6QHJ9_9BURK|nr:methionyl-tRNA formyltransferase [Roseateles toxinivorans]TDP62241.1 methionyl-tRNA formyltransferase [Roseateles toxinivorans]
MRLIFAGTPEFAAVALARLHAAGFEIALALTQPDRPAGRGLKLLPSAVKQFALDHGIPVAQPRSLRLDGKYPDDAQAARQALLAAGAEVMIVAAYGLILPQWVLDTPPRGCLNIHGSLLPRWRGAAPIHRAIEAGDAETGITIMQMDAGLDTGAMLLKEAVAIRPDDSTSTLHDRLADLGGKLIVEALRAGELRPTPQPAEGVTYAHKIEKAEAAIDWALPARQIERRLRAFDPFPGASTVIDGEIVKVWRAELVDQAGPAGTVLAVDDTGPVVACGEQALRLTELQRPGGKRQPARAYLQAKPLAPGDILAGS